MHQSPPDSAHRLGTRLRESLVKHWPHLSQERAEGAAILMARVGLGFATMPPPEDVDLAPGIAAALGPALEPDGGG